MNEPTNFDQHKQTHQPQIQQTQKTNAAADDKHERTKDLRGGNPSLENVRPEHDVKPLREVLHHDFTHEHLGGNIAAGKTSNIELDKIYARQLASQNTPVLECGTLPQLTESQAQRIATELKSVDFIYFPLFARNHWVAGILTLTADGPLLRTYDSAPSPAVRADFAQILGRVWPGLKIQHIEIPRQQRNSNDCGIFMTAVF